MLARSTVITAALLLGACAKSEPDTSTQTPPVSAAPAFTATGAPNQAPSPPTSVVPSDDHAGHEGHMAGMPSGMPMHGMAHDGGHPMAPNMPEHR